MAIYWVYTQMVICCLLKIEDFHTAQLVSLPRARSPSLQRRGHLAPQRPACRVRRAARSGHGAGPVSSAGGGDVLRGAGRFGLESIGIQQTPWAYLNIWGRWLVKQVLLFFNRSNLETSGTCYREVSSIHDRSSCAYYDYMVPAFLALNRSPFGWNHAETCIDWTVDVDWKTETLLQDLTTNHRMWSKVHILIHHVDVDIHCR